MTVKHLLMHRSICLLILVTAAGTGASVHGDDHQGVISGETNFGKPGKAEQVTRTIEISMGDNMRFTPDHLVIKQNETIRFVLKNTGTSPHEMILGTADELREHAAMMKKMPNMQHHEPSSVRVEAGKTGEIIWTFDIAGDFQFACLIPGHAEAGMRGTIVVEESATP